MSYGMDLLVAIGQEKRIVTVKWIAHNTGATASDAQEMLNQFYLAHPEQFHATFLVQRRLPNNGIHITVVDKSELGGDDEVVNVYSLQDSPIIDKSMIAAVNRSIALPPTIRVEGLVERSLAGKTEPEDVIMTVPSKNIQAMETTNIVQEKRSKTLITETLTSGTRTDDVRHHPSQDSIGSLSIGASTAIPVDEALPERQPSPMDVEATGLTSKKGPRMKTIAVPRTFMDNGYLMTEYVTELVPDDGDDAGEAPSAADPCIKGSSPPLQTKSVSTASGGKKQGTLLSFFKQK